MMTKHKIACLFMTLAALICLATAQSSTQRSKVGSSSAKTSSAKKGADPLKTATNPLTPKSAMPTAHKSPVAVPGAPKSDRSSSAELTRLERQPGKAGAKSGNTVPAKAASAPKSAEASAGTGSAINFKYQKPAGGTKAAKPDANSANSSIPRVTRKN
jgi:hypothetical protein